MVWEVLRARVLPFFGKISGYLSFCEIYGKNDRGGTNGKLDPKTGFIMVSARAMNDPNQTFTKTTLLKGLADPENTQIWVTFDRRYRPILLGCASRMGLSAEDAADTAQEAILQFVQAFREGKYDRSKGRVQAWLKTILRYRTIDLLRKKDHLRGAQGDSVIAFLADEDEFNRVWESEVHTKLLDEGMMRLRREGKFDDQTLEAFQRYVVNEEPAPQVAESLKMEVSAIYMAKHRCSKRLKSILEDLKASYNLEDL